MSDDKKVIDFEDAKQNKSVDELFKELAHAKRPEFDLNIVGKVITYSVVGKGWGERGEDTLYIAFRESIGDATPLIGALQISRSQWEEMKAQCDKSFSGLEKYAERNRKDPT